MGAPHGHPPAAPRKARVLRVATQPALPVRAETFRIDVPGEVLWRDGSPVSLRPKTWAVLRYLAERPGVLVTKEELLDAVWGDTAVTPGTLNKSIAELRDALHDHAKVPRFVATVHRRGFRFLDRLPVDVETAPARTAGPKVDAEPRPFVGRSDEFRRLDAALDDVRAGARRVVFVRGEPGIGKTTLVRAFLDSVASGAGSAGVIAATGSALSEISDAEPFFPILDAIRGLAGGPHEEVVLASLREHAPTWTRQVLGEDAPPPAAGGARPSPARVLLKLSRAFEHVARRGPLVLVLDDLHWADPSTLGLLALLGRSAEPAHLLVVVTYRPSEAVVSGDRIGALLRDLVRERRAVDLELRPFSVDDTVAYLRARFAGAEPVEGLTTLLHAHTEGNPLFLASGVDHLVERDLLECDGSRLTARGRLDEIDAALPVALVDLVLDEMRRLSPEELQVLEAASVVGPEFSVQSVAAALGADVETVERSLEELARSRRFVLRAGFEEWPDGSVGSRWRFLHAMHHRALLDRVSAARLQRWHQRIGERLESGWTERPEEVVVALAAHFEASRDAVRASRHLEAAASVAERRFAPAEARDLLERALVQLGRCPEDAASRERELTMRLRAAMATNTIEGYASLRLRDHVHRAIDLCTEDAHARLRFALSFTMVSSYLGANDPRVEQELETLRGRANALGLPAAVVICDTLAGVLAILGGRNADPAAERLEEIAAAAAPVDDDLYIGARFSVVLPAWSALRRSALGDEAGALLLSTEALTRARGLPDPINEFFALYCAAQIAAFDRAPARMESIAARSAALAREHGYHHWGGMVEFLSRHLRAVREPRRGNLDELRELADRLASDVGSALATLHGPLAELALVERRYDEGLSAVEQGLAAIESGFARAGHAQLLRMRAALRRAAGGPSDGVRADLEASLAVATAQGATGLAARAAADLAALGTSASHPRPC